MWQPMRDSESKAGAQPGPFPRSSPNKPGRKSWDDLSHKGAKLASVFKRLGTLADKKYDPALAGGAEALDQYLRLAEAMRQYALTIAKLKAVEMELEDFDQRLRVLEEAAGVGNDRRG